jgi:hypothetical protein
MRTYLLFVRLSHLPRKCVIVDNIFNGIKGLMISCTSIKEMILIVIKKQLPNIIVYITSHK